MFLKVFVNGNVRGSESKSESKSKSLSGWLQDRWGWCVSGSGRCSPAFRGLAPLLSLSRYNVLLQNKEITNILNQIKDRIHLVLNLVTQVVITNRTPSHKASYQLNTVCEMKRNRG